MSIDPLAIAGIPDYVTPESALAAPSRVHAGATRTLPVRGALFKDPLQRILHDGSLSQERQDRAVADFQFHHKQDVVYKRRTVRSHKAAAAKRAEKAAISKKKPRDNYGHLLETHERKGGKPESQRSTTPPALKEPEARSHKRGSKRKRAAEEEEEEGEEEEESNTDSEGSAHSSKKAKATSKKATTKKPSGKTAPAAERERGFAGSALGGPGVKVLFDARVVKQINLFIAGPRGGLLLTVADHAALKASLEALLVLQQSGTIRAGQVDALLKIDSAYFDVYRRNADPTGAVPA